LPFAGYEAIRYSSFAPAASSLGYSASKDPSRALFVQAKKSQVMRRNKKTLLIIEESSSVALALQRNLEALGYAVPETVSSTQEAIRSISRQHPDLVIMDIPHPEERGGNTATTLFRTQFDLPVVFITSKTDEAAIEWAKKTEPYGYLVTPVSPDELHGAIEIALHKHKMEQERSGLNKQLEIANRELSAFNYSVSHDLKTPLQGIQMISRFLLDENKEQLNEKGKKYLVRIQKAASQMGQIIDGLLALSEVTRNELRFEPVNLTALAQKTVEALRGIDSGREGVTVVIEESLMAYGDFRLLECALQNLLGNAWKFTRKQKEAKIEFGKIMQGEKQVFFVRDNGAGFNMAYLEKLFGAFERLHLATEFEGSGVGLATTCRVIERHNGRIWAEGKENQGATFYFTLPV
jgi:signal transduction histidine kinase